MKPVYDIASQNKYENFLFFDKKCLKCVEKYACFNFIYLFIWRGGDKIRMITKRILMTERNEIVENQKRKLNITFSLFEKTIICCLNML